MLPAMYQRNYVVYFRLDPGSECALGRMLVDALYDRLYSGNVGGRG